MRLASGRLASGRLDPGRLAYGRSWPLLALLALLSPSAEADTLLVGAGRPLASPSAAAKVAHDGDTVLIDPGEYYDCAVWTRNHLVIAGAAAGVVITDTTCQGKALFVVTGDDASLRNLTLTRARVPDGNGAGIRLEGQGLTVEHVRFVNNQVALLAGNPGQGAILIVDSVFENGGAGGARPTFAVAAGAVSLLYIARSSFAGIKGGQIRTFADRTELDGDQVATGTGVEPGVAVVSGRGSLVVRDTFFALGPNAPREGAAVLATGGQSPDLRGNRLVNQTGQRTALLLDWTGGEPCLEGNQVDGGDETRSTAGLWRHRAAGWYHDATGRAHRLASRVRRDVFALVGR